MKKTAYLIAALALFCACAAKSDTKSHDMAVNRNLTTFNSMVHALDQNYVDTVRTDEAFKAAIDALLGTIDPYTEYYTQDETESLRNMTTGEYAGIGSLIQVRDGVTYISQPMEGSPAQAAGLRAGDKILRVDTVNTLEPKGQNVSKLLRGEPGTTVRVTVQRPWMPADQDSVMTFDIVRRKLQQPSVPYYGVVNGGRTGYLQLTSFIDKSPEEVRQALQSFKDDPEVSSLILDLRGNGGGLVESAVEILGEFLPKGTEVLRTRYRDPGQEKVYKTTRKPLLPDIPMVVLIDGGSASASEITAGALQDLDRAVLVGSRSFGKGLVQGTLPMPYDGLLKVTMAKYYTPSGRLIQALDYSRRNPDGTVAYTPDSLTNVYHTRAGREVRDGGGLQPDTVITWRVPSALLVELMRGNRIFDYSTKYASAHDSAPAPDDFEITDEIYADFTSTLDPETFEYERRCSVLLDKLSEAIEEEGYMDDESRKGVEELRRLLEHDLKRDLELKRPEISQYLAEEIMTRYYFDKGRIRTELKDDPGLDAAIEILNTPGRYASMLRPAKKTSK